MCAKLNCLVILFFRPKSSLKRSVCGAENIVLVFRKIYNKFVGEKKMADKKLCFLCLTGTLLGADSLIWR